MPTQPRLTSSESATTRFDARLRLFVPPLPSSASFLRLRCCSSGGQSHVSKHAARVHTRPCLGCRSPGLSASGVCLWRSSARLSSELKVAPDVHHWSLGEARSGIAKRDLAPRTQRAKQVRLLCDCFAIARRTQRRCPAQKGGITSVLHHVQLGSSACRWVLLPTGMDARQGLQEQVSGGGWAPRLVRSAVALRVCARSRTLWASAPRRSTRASLWCDSS